mmetsp:Transcript_17172/g.42456  ORF Transcript_17172/g.42456 Transcript_17172/m.42456 type:complete len:208 (-) Transcript_17172:1-624(-)
MLRKRKVYHLDPLVLDGQPHFGAQVKSSVRHRQLATYLHDRGIVYPHSIGQFILQDTHELPRGTPVTRHCQVEVRAARAASSLGDPPLVVIENNRQMSSDRPRRHGPSNSHICSTANFIFRGCLPIGHSPSCPSIVLGVNPYLLIDHRRRRGGGLWWQRRWRRRQRRSLIGQRSPSPSSSTPLPPPKNSWKRSSSSSLNSPILRRLF